MTDAVGSVGLGADPGGLDRRRGGRLRRHRQDHHRPRASCGRTSSPPTTRTPRPRTPSAGCPTLVKDQPLTAEALDAVGHTTQPPARYTEASLVKALEELGIGRPSTYASIMQTIQDRGYVVKRGQALIPSFIAFAVIGLLERHYPRLVDYDFTAAMENELDEIAGGDARRGGLPDLVLLRQRPSAPTARSPAPAG